MKKTVPNLIRIETSHEPIVSERILLWSYNRIIKEGYTFAKHDFYKYCALFIRYYSEEKLPKEWIDTDEMKTRVRFELINFQILNNEQTCKEDYQFHLAERQKMVNERKNIIKKEIARTNLNRKVLNTISHHNSQFYRTLLDLTREFRDITLMDWFIPIVLIYERLIHIFIKHVEETKFGEGQFKRRSFFDYKPEEIWTLLKTIIKFEQEAIQDHFLINRVNHQLEKTELMKDYKRSFKNPIIFNNDCFALTIDKNGFIKQFYQLSM